MALLKFFQKAAQSQSTSPATASVVDDETDIQSHLQEPDQADLTSVAENPGKLDIIRVSNNS